MSSSDLAISVRGLGKSYQIDHARTRVPTFRDAVMRRLRHPFRRSRLETFWALRDVDLEINKGDVVGIIGRNGAGKSTLLKILSRITEPTTGRIDLYGRVGSLLEVGTGFHPELTGRENIFLNGSILGMRRKEIERQFEAIVDFAEVEKFLDTPVKHYSSGMYVRLAFAVAAHLNPEILVVDEVLAVGDTQFQSKCLGKMGEVARSGRTVLLVSHNVAAVSNLCTRTAVLDGGRVDFSGDTQTGIRRYVALGQATGGGEDLSRCRPAWARPLIRSVRTVGEGGQDCHNYMLGCDLLVEMSFDTAGFEPLSQPVMGVVINHQTAGVVGGINTRMTRFDSGRGPYKSGTFRCRIKDAALLPGNYNLDVWLGDGSADLDVITGRLAIELIASDVYKTGVTPIKQLGVIFLKADWEIDRGDAKKESDSQAVLPTGIGNQAGGEDNRVDSPRARPRFSVPE
jgi:lipopolysaccharide transport system ATP-binding protein